MDTIDDILFHPLRVKLECSKNFKHVYAFFQGVFRYFHKLIFYKKLYLHKNNFKTIIKSKFDEDPSFFLISISKDMAGGLLMILSLILYLIEYADKKRYIPVINMQNIPNNLMDDEKVGIENAWEYYFKQPSGYSLSDIKNKSNIIFCPTFPIAYAPVQDMNFLLGKTDELNNLKKNIY